MTDKWPRSPGHDHCRVLESSLVRMILKVALKTEFTGLPSLPSLLQKRGYAQTHPVLFVWDFVFVWGKEILYSFLIFENDAFNKAIQSIQLGSVFIILLYSK